MPLIVQYSKSPFYKKVESAWDFKAACPDQINMSISKTDIYKNHSPPSFLRAQWKRECNYWFYQMLW